MEDCKALTFRGRSYHDGEHYNSVRREDDPAGGPALPIHIEGDAQLKGPPTAQKKPVAVSRIRSGLREEDVKRVIAGTPSRDEERIKQARDAIAIFPAVRCSSFSNSRCSRRAYHRSVIKFFEGCTMGAKVL